jgi:hypothetical protein
MTKQRSSIQDKGAEILLGPATAAEIEPQAPDLAFAEEEALDQVSSGREPVAEQPADLIDEPVPQAAPWPDQAEIEEALYEEARGGAPAPEGEDEDLSILEPESLTEEMELALLEEEVEAEQALKPVDEAPAPAAEAAIEERALSEETAIYEPPPPAARDIINDVLPPRRKRETVDISDMGMETADIQEAPDVERLELPKRELTEDEERELLKRLGSERIQALDRDIDRVYDQILSTVGENEGIATECFNQVLQARDIILRQDMAMVPQAEYYIAQVRARLKRAIESEAGAKKNAWWITTWGFVWAAVFLGVLFLLNHDWFRQAILPSTAGNPSLDTETFLLSMVWGGIGGVVAIWYSLFKHVALRDFDTQYNLSYVGKPFLGLVLGATVYMLFHLMLNLRILPTGLLEGNGTALSAVTPWIIYPIAWASGFKENRIFDLVDRVIKRVFSGGESE